MKQLPLCLERTRTGRAGGNALAVLCQFVRAAHAGLSRTNEKNAILCTVASTRRRVVSFGPPALVDGQGELARAARSSSRSGLCATDNRYPEGRLLAEDARRCTAVRPLICFAGVLDGLDRPVVTSLNRPPQAFFRFIK